MKKYKRLLVKQMLTESEAYIIMIMTTLKTYKNELYEKVSHEMYNVISTYINNIIDRYLLILFSVSYITRIPGNGIFIANTNLLET